MTNRRPTFVLLGLAAYAAVAFVTAALLDVHGDWGNPRQAAANVLWITFLLSVVAVAIGCIRTLLARRHVSPAGQLR